MAANQAENAPSNAKHIAEDGKPKTPLETALAYIAHGWSPVPIEHRQKGPTLPGWAKLRLTAADVAEHFGSRPQNVGIILGSASGGLVDIDLDCPEARKLAPAFLPPTPAVFGRASNPASHWLFKVPGLTTEQIKFPGTAKVLLELRSNTSGEPSQTVFPGSTHPSGEPIEWADGFGEPPVIEDGAHLLRAFRRLSAATIAAKAFPDEGARHNATLAIIGLLLRSGWDDADIIEVVTAVRSAAGADSRKPVRKMVADGRKRLETDKLLRGFTSFAEHFGEGVANQFTELLELEFTQISADEFDDLAVSSQ